MARLRKTPERENTFRPYSPYAVAKLYRYWIIKECREAYDMLRCSGNLFNRRSERRGETFVTRKITLAAARIAQGKQDCLYLGNLDSLRDWGYAKDYVECMWLILQQEQLEDFVIATGVQHTVREFAHSSISSYRHSLTSTIRQTLLTSRGGQPKPRMSSDGTLKQQVSKNLSAL